MYLCDSHIHSRFSHDTDADPDEICLAAIAAGLDEICITDHYDENLSAPGDPVYEPDKAAPEIRRIAGKYAESLRVTYGLELGEPHEFPEKTRGMLASEKFDYIIGSLHNLRGGEDFYCVNFRDMTDSEIDRTYEEYIEQTLEMIEFGGFMSLGHFGYPLRIIYGSGRKIDLNRHKVGTNKVLSEIIRRGIALEINTCTLRMEMNSLTPLPRVISKYYDMGGRLITVGSDAHTPKYIGFGFDEAFRILRGIGFGEYTVFRGGEAVQVPIEI